METQGSNIIGMTAILPALALPPITSKKCSYTGYPLKCGKCHSMNVPCRKQTCGSQTARAKFQGSTASFSKAGNRFICRNRFRMRLSPLQTNHPEVSDFFHDRKNYWAEQRLLSMGAHTGARCVFFWCFSLARFHVLSSSHHFADRTGSRKFRGEQGHEYFYKPSSSVGYTNIALQCSLAH